MRPLSALSCHRFRRHPFIHHQCRRGRDGSSTSCSARSWSYCHYSGWNHLEARQTKSPGTHSALVARPLSCLGTQKKKEKRPQRPHGAGGPPKTPIIAAAAARQAPRRLQEGCNFHPADPPQSRIRLLASPNDTSHGPPVHPPSLVVSHRAAPLAPSGDSLFPRANRDPHPFPPDVWLRCDPPSR